MRAAVCSDARRFAGLALAAAAVAQAAGSKECQEHAYNATGMPAARHFHGFLSEWALFDVVETPSYIPISPLEMLPWIAMLIYGDETEATQGSAEAFWDALDRASLRTTWRRPPTVLRARHGEEILFNQQWMTHEPIKSVTFAAVNMLLTAAPLTLQELCWSGWSLALLLKLEFDLLGLVQDLGTNSLPIDFARLAELRHLFEDQVVSRGHFGKEPPAPRCHGTHCGRLWVPCMEYIGYKRVAGLLDYLVELLAPPPPLGLGARRQLDLALSDTWTGMDRKHDYMAHTWLGPEPAPEWEALLTLRPGHLCIERTVAMRQLERKPQGPLLLFWRRMAETLTSAFTWRLAELGGGERRAMLWKGTALIERNLTFAWQACGPAVLAVVLLRSDRWLANLNQALSYRGWQDNLVMRDLAEKNKMLYKALRDRFEATHFSTALVWVRAMEHVQRRIRDHIDTMKLAGTFGNEDTLDATRRQMERYFCHSSIGVGIMPLVASRPQPALELLGAARRTRALRAPTAAARLRRGRKLAFLFMVYEGLNFPRLWRRFFEDATRATHRIFVHASRQSTFGEVQLADSKGMPPGLHVRADSDNAFFANFRIAWRPSIWCNISLVMFGLLEAAMEDPGVQRVVFVSQDSIPLATFTQIYSWAFADLGKSWLCMDHEYTRAEPWMLLDRRHAELLVSHQSTILQLIQGRGLVDGEEMPLQVLQLLGERARLRDRCVLYAQWVLPKYFAVGRRTPLPRPPPLIGDYQRTAVGACGHPTRFWSLPAASMRKLLRAARHDQYWFARKFASNATVLLGHPKYPRGRQQPMEQFVLKELYGE